MIAIAVWWLSGYVAWAAIMFWSDWRYVRDIEGAREGFIVGVLILVLTWPMSVVMHALAETQWGRDRGLIPLFAERRK